VFGQKKKATEGGTKRKWEKRYCKIHNKEVFYNELELFEEDSRTGGGQANLGSCQEGIWVPERTQEKEKLNKVRTWYFLIEKNGMKEEFKKHSGERGKRGQFGIVEVLKIIQDWGDSVTGGGAMIERDSQSPRSSENKKKGGTRKAPRNPTGGVFLWPTHLGMHPLEIGLHRGLPRGKERTGWLEEKNPLGGGFRETRGGGGNGEGSWVGKTGS